MEFSGFDWDEGNRKKCQKHGVSMDEIEDVFFDEGTYVGPDPAHSSAEKRFRAVGSNGAGRMIFVVFTLRKQSGETFIRPISARYMHRKEIMVYEKAVSNIQE